jgi:hypothetical protein
MNPETKLVLDALTKRFDVLEASVKEASEKWEKGFAEAGEKWEQGFAEADEKWDNRFSMSEDNWERQFADLKVSQDARVEALERVSASLDAWKPEIEGTVDDIRMEVGKLSKHWGRSVRDRSPPLLPTVPSALPTPPANNNKFHSLDLKSSSVSGRPSAADETDRPYGHSVANHHQEDGCGSVLAVVHPPVRGTIPDSTHSLSQSYLHLSRPHTKSGSIENARSSYSKLPKLNFPTFDGESPKLWISHCEDYFDLYDVLPYDWIKVASMHFVDPAARWLQSMGTKIRSSSWSKFCKLVLDRFGRDHHELLVRQLFSIRQSGTVLEYVEQFSSLVDQLNAYEQIQDPLHYTMKFIDGLKPEFKSLVLMKRPSTLDTSFVLAQL